jgi:SH3 domain protein
MRLQFRVRGAAAILLTSIALPLAAADGATRYVSDELALTLRQSADNTSAGLGFVNSGTRVELLDTGGAGGYARVRTADGREGWVLLKYLKTEPAARERAQRAEKQLAEAQVELKQLRGEHDQLKQEHVRVTSGLPPPAPEQLVRENAETRAAMEKMRAEHAQLLQQHDVEQTRQRTLLYGGGLVLGGALLTLLIRVMWPRRSWGDL